MNRFRLAALLVLALGLSGCASALGLNYEVVPVGDEFDGHTGVTMRMNTLGGTPLTGGRTTLDARKLVRNGDASYFLNVLYLGSEWVFIERGESLILLIDGQRVPVSGSGSLAHREVHSGSMVEEAASYPVPASLLRQIAGAREVRVRIVGSRQNLDRHFTAENLARFREFVAQHVDES